MRVVSIPSLVAIVALVAAPSLATAQQPDVSTLLARIEQLERTVRVLEQRIAALEGVAPAPPVGLANWRQLRQKMKMDEVRELLGEPARVNADALTIRWHYGDGGRVDFYSPSERVNGWREP